jgi:hypothetical protein
MEIKDPRPAAPGNGVPGEKLRAYEQFMSLNSKIPSYLPPAKLIEFPEKIVISSVYQHQLMPSKTGGGA